MFSSVKEMSDAVKPAATVLSDRVSVTSAGCRQGRRRRQAGVDRRVRRRRGACAERRGGSSAASRPRRASVPRRFTTVHGDGARRRGWLHRAGDQRARDGVRHGARRRPIREEAQRRRVHFRDRPIGNRLHGAAPARIRRRRHRGRAARRLQRPDLHPGRSRPDEREEIQQPGSRQGDRRCARSSRKKSPRASTTSTSTPRRSST